MSANSIHMTAVITGDIINSRSANAALWLHDLKSFFSGHVSTRAHWEIFRGDSFQLEVAIDSAVWTMMCIKALIKRHKGLDVRMALGIGEKDYEGKKVTESNGTAFQFSGLGFEQLKNQTLYIKTPYEDLDRCFNAIFNLLSFICDGWKPVTAETVFYGLTHPGLTQSELAAKLGKSNVAISRALKRGAYSEVMEIIGLFNSKIKTCIH